MPALSSFAIRRLQRPTPSEIQALTELLIDCVEGGASVSFMLPLSIEKARQFWLGVAADAARGARVLLVVEAAGAIVGSVQLLLEQPGEPATSCQTLQKCWCGRARAAKDWGPCC